MCQTGCYSAQTKIEFKQYEPPTLTRFVSLRFFPLGVYQIASLQTQANQFAVVENLNILGN